MNINGKVGEISRWRSIETLSFEPLLAIVIYSLRGNNFLVHPSREEFLSVRVAFIMVERLTFRCTQGSPFSPLPAVRTEFEAESGHNDATFSLLRVNLFQGG